MSVSEICNYLNTGLLVLFIVLLVSLVLFFLRGLARGWRYGTYRVIAFAVLILIALLTLSPLTDVLGNWNLQSFGFPAISFQIKNNNQTYDIQASFGTPYSVIQTLIADSLKAYDANISPTEVQNYAIAFSKSLVMFILLILDGFLIETLGSLFVMLLWHIAFIHIIPKDKRKAAKKQGRLISGFEEVVVGVVVGAMTLFPFTSLTNSLAYGWNQPSSEEKATLSANNDTYKTIQAVVDTYDQSLFSQVFFAWTKNRDGLSFDMALTNFLTQGSYDDASIGVVNELTSFVKMGSLLVEGGLLSDKGFEQSKIPLFLVSHYAPELLRSLGKSRLVTGLLPFALNVAENIDQVSTYLKVGKGIDFSEYNYQLTFGKLADVYQSLIDNDVLKNALVDQDGNWGATSDIINAAFSSEASTPMHALISALDSEDLAVFDAVLESAVYVACCNAKKEVDSDPSKYANQLTLLDFFPSISGDCNPTDESATVPESYKNIAWGQEVATVFDSVSTIIQKDTSLLTTLTEGMAGPTYTINYDHLTAGLIDHLDAYAEGLFGVSSPETDGAISNAAPTNVPCLLDSSFIEYAMPKVFTLLQSTLNDSFSLTGTPDAIDLTTVKTELGLNDESSLADRTTAVKAEFGNLYKVIDAFVSTPEGQAFLKDTKGMPGLYFDKDGNFVGVDDGLLNGLSEGMRFLDDSKISSAILPKVFSGFLTGSSSPLKSLGLDGLTLDFSGGHIGASLADLIDAFNANQAVINYLLSSGGTINAANADSVLRGILSFKDGSGNGQLANLLKALVSNPIINPENSDNIKKLIEPFLTKMGFDTTKLVLPSTHAALADEMDNFIGVLQVISDQDALGLLMSDSVSLSSLTKISFEEIFTAINDSSILKSIMGTFLDEAILPSFGGVLSQTEIDTYRIGFSNVTDWANEGKALDALLKAAVDIGDLDHIDYLHSDPEALGDIISALAGSGIFQAKQENGDIKYVFPEYMANKLTSYFVGSPDYGRYFADPNAGGVLTTADFSRFIADFSAINTVDGWTASDGEASKISNIVRYVLRLDGFNVISATTDWRKVNRTNLQGLLNAVADSASFGPILTYHLFGSVTEAMGSSMPSLETLSNLDYLLAAGRSTAERKTEVGYLYDIIDAAVDPGFGLLDSSGKLPTSSTDFKFTNLSADFLVNPLLTSLASSQVFNGLKSGETYTAFEEEYAQILVDNSLYANKSDVETIITTQFRTNENLSDVGAWKIEIGNLCTLLSDVKALDLDLASLNFDGLFSAANTSEANEASRLRLYESLKAFNDCETLYKSLPNQLSQAVTQIANAAQYGLTSANFDYQNGDRYENSELEILSYVVKDSLSSDLSATSLSTIQSDVYSKDLIEKLAASKIFNTLKTGETETAFEKTMQKVLLDSGYYGDGAGAGVQANVKTVVLEVKKAQGWNGNTGEVKRLEAVADALPNGADGTELNLSSFSLSDFFGADPATQEQQRGKLEDFLDAANASGLLYPGLAGKIDSAISANNASSIDLDGANCFYNGYFSYHDVDGGTLTHPTLGNAYTSEEVARLTHLFKDVGTLGTIDLTDISQLDAVKATALLKDLVRSRVFNTSANALQQTVAQKVMSQTLLAGNALNDIYYFASNPKDAAGTAAFSFSDSPTKADFLAKKYFAIDGPDFLANLDLIDGGVGSLKTVIETVQTGGISAAITGNDYQSLSETDLSNLLNELNGCKLYQDCVPNLLANAFSGTMAGAISGVNLARANPYYIYYEPTGFVYGSHSIDYSYDGAEQVRYALTTYENQYEGDEIAALASLIHQLNDSAVTDLFKSSSTTSFSYSSEQIQSIHDLLSLLANSYVFNLGGPYGGNNDSSTPSALHVGDDLSVFEQALFNFLDQSGMAKLSYDKTYDYQINGTYASEAKLYSAVKTFESDFGKTSSLNGTTLHSGVWQDEIDSLTVRSSNGSTDGLLYTLRNTPEIWAILQGNNFFALSDLSAVSPDTIRILIKAMNQVDLAHDIVPYTVADMIENKLLFKTYSTVSFATNPNTSVFDTDALGFRGHYSALSVTLDSELPSGTYPMVYAYDSTDPAATQIEVSIQKDNGGNVTGHTDGTTVYDFAMNATYPHYFSIDADGVDISSLTYSLNTSNYLLSQSELLEESTDGSDKTALDVIADFADSIYITKSGGTKGYVDFSSSSDVSALFEDLTPSTSTSGAHFSDILRFISDPTGFYVRNFYTADSVYTPATNASYDFASRDIVLRRMLSFTFNTTAIDLGQYFAESTSDPETFQGAKAIFTASGYSSVVEGDWFTANYLNLGAAEVLFANAPLTLSGITIPSAHAYAEAFATLSSGETMYETTLAATAASVADSASRLGKYLAAGQLQRIIVADTDYAFPDAVAVGTYLNFRNLPTPGSLPPDSYVNLDNRKDLLPLDWEDPSFYDSDFALLAAASATNPALAILRSYFTATSLLNLTSVATNMGASDYALSVADKQALTEEYNLLDPYLATGSLAEKRLIQTFYLSTLYDDYLNRLYYHGIPAPADFFMLPSASSSLASTLSSIPTA